MDGDVVCFVKAQAPVNIAVIKYWGKVNTELKIPLNDSLSGTLSMDEMCTTTSVSITSGLKSDKLILNGQEQDLTNDKSPARQMLEDIRNLSKNQDYADHKVYIESKNNFPTAAGLASSAAGYACLAFALGQAYGIEDVSLLSRIARKGSGSACRSLFGGFVHWIKGDDDETSIACQVVDHTYWPQMRVVICVVKDDMKDVSSSSGMATSVDNSSLINYRATKVVPERIDAIKQAIIDKDYQTFATITMQDSNQFHAICLDTFPPIFYLTETSKQIIKICSIINEFYGHNKVAYTFDAGPNACIYLLDDFVPKFMKLITYFFPSETSEIKGRPIDVQDEVDDKFEALLEKLRSTIGIIPDGIKYFINTSIGDGPKLLELRRN